MKYLLISIAMLTGVYSHAFDENTPKHIIASGIIQTGSYVFFSHALGRSTEAKKFSLVTSALITGCIGFSKEIMDTEYTGGRWTPNNTEDLSIDLVTVVLTSVLIYKLDIEEQETHLYIRGGTLTFVRNF